MSEAKCRVCLQQGRMTNIFTKRESRNIPDLIMSLAKVHIYPEDGLPNTICLKCLKKLDACIDFIQLCKETDSKLRTIKIELSINIKKEKQESSQSENNSESLSHDEAVEIKTDKTCKKATKQQCSTCGKIMSSRFRLKTHLKLHSGERPYSCPHCSKRFPLAQYLKVHLRVHTGEKPFQCTECNASFAHKSGLAAHVRKHTGHLPYSCLLCPKQFRTFGHLQYHLRRHTGEKNFECETCGRSFITRSQLNQHHMTHSGDRPHVCAVCGIRLTRTSHLRRHMTLVHQQKEASPAKGGKESQSRRASCTSTQETSTTASTL